jgi:DNA-nicking Smr family endonuclease
MKTVNLKEGMPLVHEALSQLDRELAVARREGYGMVKLIHGHGSSGLGGEIRIAVQKRLREMSDRDQIRSFIFGENWARSDEQTWALLTAHSELKNDSDVGKGNRGITVVVL